jgi:hypothetical protein
MRVFASVGVNWKDYRFDKSVNLRADDVGIGLVYRNGVLPIFKHEQNGAYSCACIHLHEWFRT